MSDKKKKMNEDEININLGDLGLGSIFKGIENLVNLASKVEEKGGKIKREGKINFNRAKNSKEGKKGVFGISVKTDIGGEPVVEKFGNVRKTKEGPEIEEEREPITDVFDEENRIKIYSEIPGVKKEDINYSVIDDILKFSAERGNRKYYKEVLLPSKIIENSISLRFNNGIMILTIKKKED